MTGSILGVEKYQHTQIPEHQLEVFGLPMELVQAILRRLSLKEMVGCSLLSKAMYQITFDTNLWKTLYLRDFDVQLPMKNFSLETYKDYRRYHSHIAKGVYSSRRVKFGEGEVDLSCKLIIAGDKCVGGFNNAKVKIWDSKTWECLKSFEGHPSAITALVSAGSSIILGGYDGTIVVWDEETGCVTLSEKHNFMIHSFALADEKLISNDHKGTVKIWDRKTWECLETLENYQSGNCPPMVVDGKLFSGCIDGRIKVLDLKTLDCLDPLEGHECGIRSFALADGKLVSGDSGGAVNIWDLKEKCPWYSLGGPLSTVHSLVWAEKKLFILFGDDTIRIWDVEKGHCLATIRVGTGSESSAFTDGQLVISRPWGSDFEILDFKAEDDETFKEIAALLKSEDYDVAQEAMRRFFKMPKTAREEIYKALSSIFDCESGEDAFHNRARLNPTPEQQALAIENYLAARRQPPIAEPT